MRERTFNISTPAPFSVTQLAERWGCSTGLVRKLIDAGSLQCFRLGILIRIRVAEVERYEGAVEERAESLLPPTSFRNIPRARRRARVTPRH